jgi:hypothetical protein
LLLLLLSPSCPRHPTGCLRLPLLIIALLLLLLLPPVSRHRRHCYRLNSTNSAPAAV